MTPNRTDRKALRRVILLTIALILVFACVTVAHAANQLYWGVFKRNTTFYLEAGEMQNGIRFYTDASGGDPLMKAEITFPSFLEAKMTGLDQWEIRAVGEPGSQGVIRYEANGEVYELTAVINTKQIGLDGSGQSSWNGVNYTPAESEIKERAQLYCKTDHDYATDEFPVYPDIYCRGPRFFTYPATETQYDNILYATGWSFPDFLRMELDGGGQWNYRSDGAVVGQEGEITFFRDGTLYSMKAVVYDPWEKNHPEEEAVVLPEDATVEEHPAAEEGGDAYLTDEMIDELVDAYTTDEQKEAIAGAEETESVLNLTTVPIADEADANGEDVSLLEQTVDKDTSLMDWFELSLSLTVKNAKNGVTLAKNIPVSEIRNGLRIELSSDLIGRTRLRVMAIHDGEVIEIPIVSVDETNKRVSFFADRFSTYSIVGETDMRVTYLDKSVTVPYGETFEAPADAEKEGYTLTGWFADEALTEPFDFTIPLKDHVTIYPAYEEIPPTPFLKTTGGILTIAGCVLALIAVAAVVLGKKKKAA